MDIKQYTGENIAQHLTPAARRDAFLVNWAHMEANYGSGVDGYLVHEQILLCPETASYLYQPPAPVRYRRGSRPVLERTAEELVRDAQTETDEAIAIMRFCRDLYRRRSGRHLFYGGTEEELIEKGEQLCECLSRLFTALCETSGIPARILTHTIGGHVTAEAYADGRWGYVDPRAGMYFRRPEGGLYSVGELFDDPSLLEGQCDAVRADVSDRFTYELRIRKLRELYLTPAEVNTVKNYSLADADKYSYAWFTDSDCLAHSLNELSLRYTECRMALMHFDDKRAPVRLRFTLPDGCVLTDDVPLGVRCEGAKIPPEKAAFYLDGERIYETDGLIPFEDVHAPVLGMILLHGASGMLDVQHMTPGRHVIDAELEFAPGRLIRGSLTVFIARDSRGKETT